MKQVERLQCEHADGGEAPQSDKLDSTQKHFEKCSTIADKRRVRSPDDAQHVQSQWRREKRGAAAESDAAESHGEAERFIWVVTEKVRVNDTVRDSDEADLCWSFHILKKSGYAVSSSKA